LEDHPATLMTTTATTTTNNNSRRLQDDNVPGLEIWLEKTRFKNVKRLQNSKL